MRPFFLSSVFIVIITINCTALADQNDARLDDLFAALKSSASAEQAQSIEAQIWQIWIDSGQSDINELMAQGSQAMSLRKLDEALQIFDQIVDLAPEFAEGWNKRATVYYLRNELKESVQDVQRTLALEPRHFGAISGMGLIFMQVGDDTGALKAFEDVLKLSPQSPSAQLHVERLRKKLHDKII